MLAHKLVKLLFFFVTSQHFLSTTSENVANTITGSNQYVPSTTSAKNTTTEPKSSAGVIIPIGVSLLFIVVISLGIAIYCLCRNPRDMLTQRTNTRLQQINSSGAAASQTFSSESTESRSFPSPLQPNLESNSPSTSVYTNATNTVSDNCSQTVPSSTIKRESAIVNAPQLKLNPQFKSASDVTQNRTTTVDLGTDSSTVKSTGKLFEFARNMKPMTAKPHPETEAVETVTTETPLGSKQMNSKAEKSNSSVNGVNDTGLQIVKRMARRTIKEHRERNK